MSLLTRVTKRLVVGRPVRSDRIGEATLPKRVALPIFASDALSSVAYATQEILLMLSLAGVAYLWIAPWAAGAGAPRPGADTPLGSPRRSHASTTQ